MKNQVCPTCGTLKKENELRPGMKLKASRFEEVIYEVIDGQENGLYIILEEKGIKILLYNDNCILKLIRGTTISELNEIYNWNFTIL